MHNADLPYLPHSGGAYLRSTAAIKMCFLSIALVAACSIGHAEENPTMALTTGSDDSPQAGQFFEIDIPDGFEAQPSDEPGILRWTKESGEIYLVVGDIFAGSDQLLFKALRSAAKKDQRFSKVRTLSMRGGKAMLLKEKPSPDPDRPVSWRLIVVTKKKVINVDFTAPTKDFASFVPAFKKALKSFKLKSASS